MLKLTSKVTNIPKIGPKYEFLLSKLGIFTIKDLIYHVPFRYDDFSKVKKINELKSNEMVSVDARLISINNIFTRNKKRLTKAIIQDETGKAEAIWFNMHYLTKSLEIGEIYRFTGKTEASGSKVSLLAPTQQKINSEDSEGRIIGIYPETEGINSKFLRDKIKFALDNIEIEEFLPDEILKKYNFKKTETIYKAKSGIRNYR